MMKKIQVIDNIISKKEQENLKNIFYSNQFPWFYTADVTSSILNKKQSRPAFSHIFMKDGNINSDYYNIVKKISDNVNKKIKKKLIPYQVRSFLQLSLDKNLIGNSIDTPHIDMKEPHLVYLYYVNDCDGDTVIYDYISKGTHILDIPFYEDIKIKKKITPKQGMVVIFDGMTWHTSTQPTRGTRCIINFDMINNKTWQITISMIYYNTIKEIEYE